MSRHRERTQGFRCKELQPQDGDRLEQKPVVRMGTDLKVFQKLKLETCIYTDSKATLIQVKVSLGQSQQGLTISVADYVGINKYADQLS